MLNLRTLLLAFTVVMSSFLTAGARTSFYSVSFPTGEAGATAEKEVEFAETATIAVSLRFNYKPNDPADRDRAWTLAGGSARDSAGQWREPGAALRLAVSVARVDLSTPLTMAETVVNSPKLSSWGSGQLDAELLTVTLQAGKYRVTVKNLDSAPTFVGAPISITVGRAYRGK